MSNAVADDREGPRGTRLLPADLSDTELAAAPVLGSIDDVVIEELTLDEDEAFARALAS